MDIRDGFVGTIGNTPLIRLRRASEATGCEILGKAEFLNPGGSVKDRAAWAIVKDAEEKGRLRPGGVIVEGTAGNTGIGLALVGRARGYRTVIVIPETQSQEKKDMLRLCGAELREVPAVPYRDPNNYVHVSQRLAEALAEREPNGAIWAQQFDNVANRQGHYETTGPEIWRQTDGKVDGFICAIGTGGTIAGTSTYLKEQNPEIRIGVADAPGAAMYDWFVNGEVKSEGSSISEGIGLGRVTPSGPERVSRTSPARVRRRARTFELPQSTAMKVSDPMLCAPDRQAPDSATRSLHNPELVGAQREARGGSCAGN